MTIRQFKQENPNYVVPQQHDGISLSIRKLFQNVDKILKRMTN